MPSTFTEINFLNIFDTWRLDWLSNHLRLELGEIFSMNTKYAKNLIFDPKN